MAMHAAPTSDEPMLCLPMLSLGSLAIRSLSHMMHMRPARPGRNVGLIIYPSAYVCCGSSQSAITLFLINIQAWRASQGEIVE